MIVLLTTRVQIRRATLINGLGGEMR